MKNKSFTPLHPESPSLETGDEGKIKIKPARKPRPLGRGVTGFTLIELLVVIIIIGILATLGLTQYSPYRERVLDKEAITVLKLMQQAQRIYMMDYGAYYPTGGSTSETDIAKINSDLKLFLNERDEKEGGWDYVAYSGGAAGAGTSAATRSGRTWTLPINGINSTCTGNCYN